MAAAARSDHHFPTHWLTAALLPVEKLVKFLNRVWSEKNLPHIFIWSRTSLIILGYKHLKHTIKTDLKVLEVIAGFIWNAEIRVSVTIHCYERLF